MCAQLACIVMTSQRIGCLIGWVENTSRWFPAVHGLAALGAFAVELQFVVLTILTDMHVLNCVE